SHPPPGCSSCVPRGLRCQPNRLYCFQWTNFPYHELGSKLVLYLPFSADCLYVLEDKASAAAECDRSSSRHAVWVLIPEPSRRHLSHSLPRLFHHQKCAHLHFPNLPSRLPFQFQY